MCEKKTPHAVQRGGGMAGTFCPVSWVYFFAPKNVLFPLCFRAVSVLHPVLRPLFSVCMMDASRCLLSMACAVAMRLYMSHSCLCMRLGVVNAVVGLNRRIDVLCGCLDVFLPCHSRIVSIISWPSTLMACTGMVRSISCSCCAVMNHAPVRT